MKIGLTYDLREEYLKQGFSEEETLEFDRGETIDAIEGALKKIGYETCRVGNIKNLVTCLAKGERWDLVFNIAEGLYGSAREAQVPAILDAYKIPYTFSDSLVLTFCLHKGMAKQIVRNAGLPTCDFFVVEKENDIPEFNFQFPLFAKPVAEGTSKGITSSSKINNLDELKNVSSEILKKYHQPVIVEEYLPGREFTVGIIGTKEDAEAVGVMEIFLKGNAEQDVYSYNNKENSEELVDYELATDESAKKSIETALSCWKVLGCRDAGRIDIRCDKNGIPNFIEANPLAGLHPTHSDLPMLCAKAGIDYKGLIEKIMHHATKRIIRKVL